MIKGNIISLTDPIRYNDKGEIGALYDLKFYFYDVVQELIGL